MWWLSSCDHVCSPVGASLSEKCHELFLATIFPVSLEARTVWVPSLRRLRRRIQGVNEHNECKRKSDRGTHDLDIDSEHS